MVLYGVVGGDFMAYFLKKSKLKKGIYLQIYESFYNPDKKETAHKSYKALSYVQDLIDSGIPDPIAYYSDVVAQMNLEQHLLFRTMLYRYRSAKGIFIQIIKKRCDNRTEVYGKNAEWLAGYLSK